MLSVSSTIVIVVLNLLHYGLASLRIWQPNYTAPCPVLLAAVVAHIVDRRSLAGLLSLLARPDASQHPPDCEEIQPSSTSPTMALA